MAITSILCTYSGDAARGSGLRHAIRLARHHGAHLTGVLRHGPSKLESRFALHLPRDVLAQLRSIDDEHIAAVGQRFREAAETAQLTDAAFVEIDPAVDGPISAYAHAFDLVVTGVPSDDEGHDHLSAHPDALALRSGRPVLVVPNGYEAEGLATRAIVAWDGRRAAARALGDAMAVLAEKSHVTLLSVGQTPRGTDRMVKNMTRHGITADSRTIPRDGSIAQTLLSAADADGAKLMVMGAFEHSKFAHDMFGGVTTDVIAKSKIPVFLAH